MNWGRKVLRRIYPLIRLATIFTVALFLPRFFIRTFKKEEKQVQSQPTIQVASHPDLAEHNDEDKKKEKKLLLKKLHTLS